MHNAASASSPVHLRDPKKWLYSLSIPHAAVPILAVLGYQAAPHPLWLFVPLVWIMMIVPLIDQAIGVERRAITKRETEHFSRDPLYSVFLYLAGAVYLGSIAATIGLLTILPVSLAAGVFLLGAAISNAQILTIAHELGHRGSRWAVWATRIFTGIVGYGHITTHHNGGHHIDVATPEDCTSARYNEPLYAFIVRETVNGIAGAWRREKRRLLRRGQPAIHADNELIKGYAVTLLAALLMALAFGPLAIPILLLHHGIVFATYSAVSYIEHYALLREKRPDGRYERVQPKHSWNTDYLFSNVVMVNLQRHSDHHAHAARPYQCLRTFDDLPTLPAGYPGCMLLAALPPVWFAVMNPRALAWAGGDESKLNHGFHP